MKNALLCGLLAPLLMASLSAAPADGKRFQSGSSGLGGSWSACWDGEVLKYVVFAYGARPREIGEESAEWVKVANAGGRHPKATFYRNAHETTDLLAADDQIYQVDKTGQVSTWNEHVTANEYRAFIDSQPQEYTAEALLTFVRAQRAKGL